MSEIKKEQETFNEKLAEKVDEKAEINSSDGLSDKQRKKLIKELTQKNAELQAELENEKSLSAKYKDSWYRVSADFENYKKRNELTRSTSYSEGKQDAFSSIFVIGDNLYRALAMQLDEKTKEGMQMTARSYLEILESQGITEINPVGEDFDPQTMEAIMKVPKEEGEQEGKVKQVFLRGYKLGDKVLRYAQVVVIG